MITTLGMPYSLAERRDDRAGQAGFGFERLEAVVDGDHAGYPADDGVEEADVARPPHCASESHDPGCYGRSGLVGLGHSQRVGEEPLDVGSDGVVTAVEGLEQVVAGDDPDGPAAVDDRQALVVT
jgi:hypothetical protein